jgi:hypothetical protein
MRPLPLSACPVTATRPQPDSRERLAGAELMKLGRVELYSGHRGWATETNFSEHYTPIYLLDFVLPYLLAT